MTRVYIYDEFHFKLGNRTWKDTSIYWSIQEVISLFLRGLTFLWCSPEYSTHRPMHINQIQIGRIIIEEVVCEPIFCLKPIRHILKWNEFLITWMSHAPFLSSYIYLPKHVVRNLSYRKVSIQNLDRSRYLPHVSPVSFLKTNDECEFLNENFMPYSVKLYWEPRPKLVIGRLMHKVSSSPDVAVAAAPPLRQ